MKKVIVGYLTDGKNSGIDKYLLNFLSVVHKDDLQIDFLSSYHDDSIKDEIKKFNSKLYKIPSLKNPVKQINVIRKIIRDGNYDVAYFNISECINLTGIYAAHKEKLDRIIIHSHNSGIGGDENASPIKRKMRYFLHCFCKLFLYRWGNVYIGCSKKAGEWLFPNKIVESSNFTIINNAIQVEKFAYSPEKRLEIRKKLEIENNFVIGHIGRFAHQKNHEYLIDIFAAVAKKYENAKLILVGEGPTQKTIEQKVSDLKLQEKVLFLGSRPDVPVLLQGMDVFILPSRFEGLPIVGVEAAISGLPCLFSDNISQEVKITENCKFYSIHEDPELWAKEILILKNEPRKAAVIIDDQYCFDIHQQKEQLLNIISGS